MKMGQSANQYNQDRSEDDEVWIKGFKDGETRVRFLQPTDQWSTYAEHYNEDTKTGFPCTEDKETCVGCTDESEKTRKRSRRYAVNALDEQGRLNVYRLGTKLHRTLQGREQRLGTIMDRDYTIVRSGKGLDTQYDVDPEKKYRLDRPVTEIHNITRIVRDKYAKTYEDYNGEPWPQLEEAYAQMGLEIGSDYEMVPAPVNEWTNPEGGSPAPAGEDEPTASMTKKGPDKIPDRPDPASLETAQLKLWLAKQEIEFTPTWPRARLVKVAKKWLEENPAEDTAGDPQY